MAVLSGLQLAVQGIPSVAAWQITTVDEAPGYVATSTKEAVARICGIQDWQGRISCYGHTPAYYPGDTFTFVGSLDGANGVHGDCIVAAVSVIANYAQNAPYVVLYEIAGQAPLEFGAASAEDTEEPTIICPAGQPVYVDSEQLQDVQAWRIRLSREPIGYAATETNRFRKKLAGPFDAQVEIQRYINTQPPPEMGTEHALQLYVDTGKSWRLSNMKVLQVEDYGGDLQLLTRGTRPDHRIVFGLSSAGQIENPANRLIWPTSSSSSG